MRIEIEGFQPIRKLQLEIEGLTVIVGTTHSGKSSIIRAIEAALYNAKGNYFIRQGSSFCSVHLNFEFQGNKKDWIWSKGKTAQLEFDGGLWKKLGSSPPSELLDAVGFQEIQIGETTIRPHFQRQLSPLFALTEKSTTLFNMLLSFSELHKLPIIRKTISQDINAARIDVKSATQSLEIEEARLEKLRLARADLETEPCRIYQECISSKEPLDNLSAWIDHSAILRKRREDLTVFLSLLDDSINKLSTLTIIIQETEELSLIIEEITNKSMIFEVLSNQIQRLGPAISQLQLIIEDTDKLSKTAVVVYTRSSQNDSIADLLTSINNYDSVLYNLIQERSEFNNCPTCGAPLKEGHYHGTLRNQLQNPGVGETESSGNERVDPHHTREDKNGGAAKGSGIQL